MEEAPRALFAIGRPGSRPAFLPVEVLEDVEPLAPPVPATGRLWVWQWDG